MPATRKDESTFPMLGSHKSEEEYDDVDIEEHASDLLSNKTSITTFYEKSAPLSSRNRQDSYSSSWSADTFTPSSRKARSFAPFLAWLRWGVVVGLQSIIVVLLLCQRKLVQGDRDTDAVFEDKVVETGGDINGLYKTCECPMGLSSSKQPTLSNMVLPQKQKTIKNWQPKNVLC